MTVDAMGCQKQIVNAIRDQQADYVVTVKGNQPTVREQIETLVTAPQGDFPPS